MSTQTLTLQLPDPLYTRLQERARQFNRTLEAELLEVLNTAVPADESLPDSLAEDMDDWTVWTTQYCGRRLEAGCPRRMQLSLRSCTSSGRRKDYPVRDLQAGENLLSNMSGRC